MSSEYVGYSAVIIGAISAAPQLYQIINTRQVRDINLYFFFLRALSSILYISYGLLVYDYVMTSSAIMPLFFEMCINFIL